VHTQLLPATGDQRTEGVLSRESSYDPRRAAFVQNLRRGHYEIAADLRFLSGGWATRRGKRRISAVRVIRCASSGVLYMYLARRRQARSCERS
jgi:hypothetical protein